MKTKILRSILFLAILLYIPIAGSDCNEIFTPQETCNGGDVTGNWVLVYNSGSNHDVCPGETVSYPNGTSGTATLQCPNSTPITRGYSVSGATLTYTDNQLKYCINFVTDTLKMSSTSLPATQSRTLIYVRQ